MPSWSWFSDFHRSVYERSDGRLMARLAGIDMLLLTTTGRKSGLPRTLPLACFPDGDDLVVVASNNGLEYDPAWWKNLQAKPEARVRFRRDRFRVRARLATDAERERLWPLLKRKNPPYRRYEKKTSRRIPVVILERA